MTDILEEEQISQGTYDEPLINRSLLLIALIPGILVFVVAAWDMFIDVGITYPSVTGYLLVPVIALVAFLTATVISYSLLNIGYRVYRFQKGEKLKLLDFWLSVLIVLGTTIYCITLPISSYIKELNTIEQSIKTPNQTSVEEFINTYNSIPNQFGYRYCVLNMRLQNKTLTEEELLAFAKMNHPDLFEDISDCRPPLGFPGVWFGSNLKTQQQPALLILNHPNVNDTTLKALAEQPFQPIPTLHLQLARQPKTNTETIKILYINSRGHLFESAFDDAFKAHPNTPKNIKSKL